ncbi:glutathione S-transferase C-terminal domain-containing protein [Streptomyces sp. NPDC059564]|uniref:glutathione S-transferase C-terminal domain-containing protein n=1 Tax=Streptomyces sp. NPDC059564 TaxID=3346865 RepID=UPI0036AB91B2
MPRPPPPPPPPGRRPVRRDQAPAVNPAPPPPGRAAALALLDRRLAVRPYALGDRPTVTDADLWTALLDPAVLPAAGPNLRAYVRRLRAHPAFGAAS